jgi:hypothetical protein
MDPLTGRNCRLELRPGPAVFLRLPPGASLLVRTFAGAAPPAPPWRWDVPTQDDLPLTRWTVSFLHGGPALPPATTADGPRPWSALPGEVYRSFSRTAVYRTDFERPSGPGPWVLELGEVNATALVRVNGAEVGRLWAAPFAVDVTAPLRPGRNTLEVEVTSLPANRVAALARAGAPRLHYHDIDFVDRQYHPFDPSGWPPLPSGLAGPVQLRRYRGLSDATNASPSGCAPP